MPPTLKGSDFVASGDLHAITLSAYFILPQSRGALGWLVAFEVVRAAQHGGPRPRLPSPQVAVDGPGAGHGLG